MNEGTGDDAELVPVLRSTDPALLPVVKSLLGAAGIPYVVQGEAGVSLFPLGPAAARVTGRSTGAVVLVARRHAEEARALLDSASDPAPDG